MAPTSGYTLMMLVLEEKTVGGNPLLTGSRNISTSTPALQGLYHQTRLPKGRHLSKLVLLLYSPIGIMLALGRLTVTLLLSMSHKPQPGPNQNKRPHHFCRWLYQVHVKEKGTEHLKQATSPQVLACNHVSLMDGPALSQHLPATILRNDDTNAIATQTSHLVDSYTLTSSIAGRRSMRADLLRAFATGGLTRLLAFPEGVISNGSGLHVFQKFVFALGIPVIPVCLKIKTPLPVNLHPLNHSHALNFLWMWFLPWMNLEVTYLPKMEIQAEESAAEFAERVRLAMAAEMQIPATAFSARSKRALKKQPQPQPQPAASPLRAMELRIISWLQHTCASPWLDGVMKALSLAGKPYVYAAGIIALAFAAPTLAWNLFLLLLVAEILQWMLKKLFKSPRPSAFRSTVQAKIQESGNGLPSAHVQNAVVIGGTMFFATGSSTVLVLAAAWVLITAFSRLYLGVHFIRDVVAGMASGIVLLTAANYHMPALAIMARAGTILADNLHPLFTRLLLWN